MFSETLDIGRKIQDLACQVQVLISILTEFSRLVMVSIIINGLTELRCLCVNNFLFKLLFAQGSAPPFAISGVTSQVSML